MAAKPSTPLLQSVLSGTARSRLSACRALKSTTLPLEFLKHLLMQLPDPPLLSPALCLVLFNSSRQLCEFLFTLATSLRSHPPAPRVALTYARAGAILCSDESLEVGAVDVLHAAMTAMERYSGYRGPQLRSKTLALTAAYATTGRELPGKNRCIAVLLDTVEREEVSPCESVAALGMLATVVGVLSQEDRSRFLLAATIVCMRAGADTARRVTMVAACPLRDAEQGFVIHKVMPLVAKALLRAPEVSLSASTVFLRALRTDLSSCARNGLFPAVMQAIKSGDDETRAYGVELASVVGSRLKGSGSLADGVASLCTCLKGARYVYQKVASLQAISEMACAAEAEEVTARRFVGIEIAVDGILTWLNKKKETNGEVRYGAIRALVKLVSTAVTDLDDMSALPAKVKPCSQFFIEILTSPSFEVDRLALLAAMTADLPSSALSVDFLGATGVVALQSTITTTLNTRDETCLRALAIHCEWARECRRKRLTKVDSQLCDIFQGDNFSSSVLEPGSLTSLSLAQCALSCCDWMVSNSLDSSSLALETVFKLCMDSRAEVSSAAIRQVRTLRRQGGDVESMFTVLWEAQFCSRAGKSSIAKSRDFDDGMVVSEKLGRTLMAAVMPHIPEDIIPLVLLAANHPRLLPCVEPGRRLPRSRYWGAIERCLKPIQACTSDRGEKDWLERSLCVIFSADGLQNCDSVQASAALNALGALADSRNEYSSCVVRTSMVHLVPFVSGAVQLGEEALAALRLVRDTDEQQSVLQGTTEESTGSFLNRLVKTNGGIGPSSGRPSQQTQAEIDKARAAHASAIAVTKKADAARGMADNALRALHFAHGALKAVHRLARVAPSDVHICTPALLPLILPLARFEILEGPCRDALSALTVITSRRLRPLSVDIGISLYGLERGLDVRPAVCNVLDSLASLVPPALQAEDFSLVLPIIRAALVQKELNSSQKIHGTPPASYRRDPAVLGKSAAKLLAEHCKPVAIDAAFAAASSNAGAWALQALEREDGAFGAAADALLLLTGSVLAPCTDQLRQVLEGITSGKASVRDAALTALTHLPQLSSPAIVCPRDANLGRMLWLARFDPDEANSELADELWIKYGHTLNVHEDVPGLIALLPHAMSDIRRMSAKAVAAALRGKVNVDARKGYIPRILEMYSKNVPGAKSESGVGDRIPFPDVVAAHRSRRDINEKTADCDWQAREGVGLAVEELAKSGSLDPKDVRVCFAFLSGHGLGDSNDSVNIGMTRAARALVEAAGPDGPSVILPMIEEQLSIPPSGTPGEIQVAEQRKETLVTCLGTVAEFLPSDDSRISKIGDQVMNTALESASPAVQNTAARCLARLVRASPNLNRMEEMTEPLLKSVGRGDLGYIYRRGGAYALAGICKGLGLKYMKRLRTMELIEAAVADKSPRIRQGGLLLIEAHSALLERAFEPYSVACLPLLLSCMGDSSIEVRNACWAAAQAAMREISSQGVKMVLPMLLTGLKDRQWRTKSGSAELLGAMAFCAPRQLSQCLPQIVPKLSEALADAHPRVVNSAESAVNRIAAVVRSPEVRMLSPFLLAAFRDPAGRTRGAIDAMLGCEFVHTIDVASLALLIPPLHRGLRDRSAELKKRSAAIVGSMCNNVSNQLDVVPYLGMLLPALKATLLDSIPEVRRTSARALGALALSLGEEGLPGIVPWLLKALLDGVSGSVVVNETSRGRVRSVPLAAASSAERSGAALGLAEVAASMDDQRLEDIISRVLDGGRHSTEAKEGGLMLIASLPKALGGRFEDRLERALCATLQGLSDDADSVREAALDAGRSLVSAYANTSLDQLLPALLSAMRDKSWRIRSAATRLLGDMLCVIAGASALQPDLRAQLPISESGEKSKNVVSAGEVDAEGLESGSDEMEDAFESPEQAAAAMSTDAAMKAIEKILGRRRHSDVLAALYIVRCDVSLRVRQTGMQVWKAVVSNTPRVLKEIMPSTVSQIIEGLGDEDEERRATVGRTLADLSQKLGSHVVPEVLPPLKSAIADKSSSERMRRGACDGLRELVLACPMQQLDEYASSLIDAVYKGLCDDQPTVRVIAAQVFSYLLRSLGNTPVEFVVPRFMDQLSASDEESDQALNALKEILKACGSRLMALVVPRLLKKQPIQETEAQVLAIAASVAESSFVSYTVDVTKAVLYTVEVMGDTCLPYVEPIIAAVASNGEQSAKALLEEILIHLSAGPSEGRIAAAKTCGAYCRSAATETVADMSANLLPVLIQQLADANTDVAQSALKALLALSLAVPTLALSAHIPIIRLSLRTVSAALAMGDEHHAIFGLNLSKASGLFANVFAKGLLHGEPQLREQAALGIGEYVELSAGDTPRSFVIKMVGPMIRVMSDRFQWQVKAAVLKTLLVLLKKTPQVLRTFTPQLQSVFVKSLSDSNHLVRKRAGVALGALTPILSRLEGLLNDLISMSREEESATSRAAALHSCCQVFRLADPLPDVALSKLPGLIAECLSDQNAEVRTAAGLALACLANRVKECSQYVNLLNLVAKRVDADRENGERVAALRAIGAMFLAGRHIEGVRYEHVAFSIEQVVMVLQSTMAVLLCAGCATSADLLLLLAAGLNNGESYESRKVEMIRKICELAEGSPHLDVRVSALNALSTIVQGDTLAIKICSHSLVVCASESNTRVRDHAYRVMRRAFLSRGDNAVNHGNVQLAKLTLDEPHQVFLDRQIARLKAIPESESERQDAA